MNSLETTPETRWSGVRIAAASMGALTWLAASTGLTQAPPPGAAPEARRPQLFAPGVVSVGGLTTYRPSFSPDGRTVYFTVDVRGGYAIGVSQFTGGAWSPPELASFSGRWSDAEAFLSPDGSRLFFASQRPVAAGGPVREDYDIWVVERSRDGRLGEPRRLGGGVNTAANELYPSVSRSRTLYFSRSEGGERSDLWRASRSGSDFSAPERLPAPVNSEAREAGVHVSPDESYILFESTRAGGLGGTDIYRSDRLRSGWSEPWNLGAPVNSPAAETSATISPDGRTLFFTSSRRLPRPGIGAGLSLRELIDGATAPGSGREHIYFVPFAPYDQGAASSEGKR